MLLKRLYHSRIEVMYMCVRYIDFACFYEIPIEFWKVLCMWYFCHLKYTWDRRSDIFWFGALNLILYSIGDQAVARTILSLCLYFFFISKSSLCLHIYCNLSISCYLSDRTQCRLFQKTMNVPNEGYSRRLWAYPMKVIPEDYERIHWRLFQKTMSVPNEGYSRRLWAYPMKVIPEDYERTQWRLFQKTHCVISSVYWIYYCQICNTCNNISLYLINHKVCM
jgi:hypothetical protein